MVALYYTIFYILRACKIVSQKRIIYRVNWKRRALPFSRGGKSGSSRCATKAICSCTTRKRARTSPKVRRHVSYYLKGIIPLKSVLAVNASMVSKNEFTLALQERDFQLRAKNEEIRDNWVATLTFLKEYKLKEEKEKSQN